MKPILRLHNLKIFIIILMVFVAGCSRQPTDTKLYFEYIEDNTLDENRFQIDKNFDYSQIIFRLYFIDESFSNWKIVETYQYNNYEIYDFTTGFNHWYDDIAKPVNDSQLYLVFGDNMEKHTLLELNDYGGNDAYNGGGGFYLEKKELSYDEIPFHLKKFTKAGIDLDDRYSIPFNWVDYKFENMKMTDEFNCKGYSCYVYTLQLIP